MTISGFCAMTEAGVIGHQGQLPWGKSLQQDLAFFQRKTTGQCLLMGWKTYVSLGMRALPQRTSLVLTRKSPATLGALRSHDPTAPLYFLASLPAALHQYQDLRREACVQHRSLDLCVIGGAEVYRQTYMLCEVFYRTVVHHDYPGDVHIKAFRAALLSRVTWEYRKTFCDPMSDDEVATLYEGRARRLPALE
jgi:dihydrofolate reductase